MYVYFSIIEALKYVWGILNADKKIHRNIDS